MDNWFRVEVSDREGQIVAIESEMLTGRDIGEREQETINRAIDHLSGFIGRDIQAPALAAEIETLKLANGKLRDEIKQMEKDCREAIRDAAGEAQRSERYPDEPYGTY